ncbi:MAG TPA: archease [Thermodesulfobacteriota bacterium]|nr:archease [Thermodesulfobacteriota bacterium]
MGRYTFLEEGALADCVVELEGRDLDDLFATAAQALAELMADPATVPRTVERRVTLEAPARDLLLYDWLSELILRKDRDREIFPEAEVTVRGEGPFTLDARLRGGPLDAERTALGADPKAVTFHQFRLEPAAGGWRARVVIDI